MCEEENCQEGKSTTTNNKSLLTASGNIKVGNTEYMVKSSKLYPGDLKFTIGTHVLIWVPSLLCYWSCILSPSQFQLWQKVCLSVLYTISLASVMV